MRCCWRTGAYRPACAIRRANASPTVARWNGCPITNAATSPRIWIAWNPTRHRSNRDDHVEFRTVATRLPVIRRRNRWHHVAHQSDRHRAGAVGAGASDRTRLMARPTLRLLICVRCHCLTTELEAAIRIFRHGRCAYCGGYLVRYPLPDDADPDDRWT